MNAPFALARDPLASARAFVAEAANLQILVDYVEAEMHIGCEIVEIVPEVVLALLEIAGRHAASMNAGKRGAA